MKLLKLSFVLSVFLLLGFAPVNESSSFYEYKNNSKFIDIITGDLNSDSVDFRYGVQPYQKRDIKFTTCFYNQPTDILHYVLNSKSGRTIHFEIPMLQLSSVTTDPNFPQTLQLQMKPNEVIWLKEFTKVGGLVYQSGVSVLRVPISKGVPTQTLIKSFNKLIKRASKF